MTIFPGGSPKPIPKPVTPITDPTPNPTSGAKGLSKTQTAQQKGFSTSVFLNDEDENKLGRASQSARSSLIGGSNKLG